MLNKAAFILGTGMMLALPAVAQDGGGSASGALMQQMLFILPMILLFYFLLIRPQQQRQKQHRAMIDAVRKGDTIVTSGGLIGKVTKTGDAELTVELADNVRVRVMRAMIADVRGKGQLVPANDSKPS